MKTEKPKNKKPLIYYYFVMLIALMAFNLFVTPMIQNQRIKEVGYSDLIAALDEKTGRRGRSGQPDRQDRLHDQG